ncbi:MAG: GTP cyclohydrolase II [Campylobacteraceae bacterium]|mgnify:CR=1 FL=1|jgi:GTP cyclohydrolase II|nr:GTP cyclohydrolase II [Campylobacteraceae bacterium]MBT3882022.1 GTP cyclohydrolase II [Campylobacteraceae bacterium]MBT4029976.1 GTP cyclohydrolase II [Campylobacteraceae bacterium]MBT4179936.1 GTP cyclohydrolase II [Campylobacteraceae bacterium]MBT4572240.1 GTP cyclohydrolase II [Campylobacteraceae bacterium]
MNIEVSKQAKLPTTHGEFIIQSFKEGIKEHLVIFTKTLDETPMVRIHSECLTGDAIGSIKCDCQAQLNYALDFINEHNGMVIYLRQEGRDIGLLNKVNAYNLQDSGLDTVEANHQLGFADDERTYEVVDFIFDYYKINQIKLLTNNPTKLNSLKVDIIQRLPIQVGETKENTDYLKVKKDKMDHLL